MGGFLTELRQAVRLLIRDRGFTAAALVTLALGIGACTAIFTLMDRLLLQPLPFPHADRLVRITGDFDGRGTRDVGLGSQELFDLAARTDLFDAVSGVYPINVNLTGTDEPERIEMQLVSVNYFALLGAGAQVGRVFAADDYRSGIAEVAVISDGLWTRRFGRDPEVIGRRIRLDNDLFTIIGVMPRTFRHPGRSIDGAVDLWSPAGYRTTPFRGVTRGINFLAGAFARLTPDVSIAVVQERLDRLTQDLAQQHPDAYPAFLKWRLRVVPLQDDLVGNVRAAILVLMGAVALVLIIGCANLANLLLVRADARMREMTVRRALGAGGGRIVRQMLIESCLVALVGGALGVLTASWGLDALMALAPIELSSRGPISLDMRALAFSLATAMSCGILFGLVPAWRSAGVSLAASGRERIMGDAPASRRARDLLVVSQSALALVLLIGSLLVLRSVGALLAVDPGFDGRGVLTARIWMPQPNDPSTGPYFTHDQRMPFYRRLLERVQALPGVEAAGFTTAVPLFDRRATQGVWIEGRPIESVETVVAQQTSASPGYFGAMKVDLVRGRLFTEADDEHAPPVLLVNETFVRRFFGTDDPVGRRIRPGGRTSTAPWMTIVGIVRDVRSDGLDREAPPQMYRMLYQTSSLLTTLIVRGQFDATTMGRTLASEVRGVDPELPVFAVRPLEAIVSASLGTRRLAVQLLSLFAGIALLLSAIGTYSVMSYLVGTRQRELGVRLALGATPRDVVRLVLGRGALLAATSIALGLAGAAALSSTIRGLLYDLAPLDAVSYLGAALLLGLVALIACWLPARRAGAIDPVRMLRAE